MAEQQLPPDEVALLTRLRTQDPAAFRRRVRLLRRQGGWTLQAIGSALGAPRSTVRSWENHPDATQAPDQYQQSAAAAFPLPHPPNLRPSPSSSPSLRVRALSPDVPVPDRDRIACLAPLARKVRAGTSPSAPSRQAKRELDALLTLYHSRGVPTQRLASLAGVTYRAMSVRLREAAA